MMKILVLPKLFVISISPSEREFLVKQAGNRVLVYDATDGDLVHSLKGHKDLAKGMGENICQTPFLAHISYTYQNKVSKINNSFYLVHFCLFCHCLGKLISTSNNLPLSRFVCGLEELNQSATLSKEPGFYGIQQPFTTQINIFNTLDDPPCKLSASWTFCNPVLLSMVAESIIRQHFWTCLCCEDTVFCVAYSRHGKKLGSPKMKAVGRS